MGSHGQNLDSRKMVVVVVVVVVVVTLELCNAKNALTSQHWAVAVFADNH